eukprot:COSAG02_NODE_1339_length_13187_cov_610.871027_1_plen_364_part_10
MPRQRAEFFIATAMTGLWEAKGTQEGVEEEDVETFVLKVSRDGTVEGRSVSTSADPFRMTGQVEGAVFYIDQVYDSDGGKTHWHANVGRDARQLRDGRWSGEANGQFHARWLRNAEAQEEDQQPPADDGASLTRERSTNSLERQRSTDLTRELSAKESARRLAAQQAAATAEALSAQYDEELSETADEEDQQPPADDGASLTRERSTNSLERQRSTDLTRELSAKESARRLAAQQAAATAEALSAQYDEELSETADEISAVCSWCKEGAFARFVGRIGQITMDPDSDGEVKLQYADGSESGYIGISQLAPATRAEFARQQLAYSWCKEGAFAGRIGQITMDPDSDGEVKLQYADGSESGYIGIS